MSALRLAWVLATALVVGCSGSGDGDSRTGGGSGSAGTAGGGGSGGSETCESSLLCGTPALC
ncbi:MAG: hypothetical protein WBN29_02355, partial [Polyangiales bacterium]